MFLLNSNSAAKDIAHLTLSFDKQAKDRSEFELRMFQTEIQNSIYHNKGEREREARFVFLIKLILILF